MNETRKFFSVFQRSDKLKIIVLTVQMIFGSMLETLTTALILPIMNALTENDLMGGGRAQNLLYRLLGGENTRDFIIRLLIFLALIYILKGLYTIWNTNIQQRFLRNFRTKMSSTLYANLMKKPYSYHLSHSTADIQRMVVTDVESFCGLLNSLISILSELFTMILIIAVLVAVNPLLTFLAGFVIFLSAVISNYAVMKRVTQAGYETREQYKKELQCVNESVGGLKSIYVGHRQQFFIERFRNYVYCHADAVKKNMVLGSVPRAIVESLSMSGIFLVIVILIMFDADIEALLPLLATFAVAAVKLIPCANRINSGINTAQYAQASVDAIYETLSKQELNKVSEIVGKDKHIEIDTSDLEMSDIQIRNLSFSYQDAEKEIISNVTFDIPVGKSVAFVGATGAGKSTMADLILGLHAPTCGRILVGGRDIAKENEWWSKKVGYIPQSIYLCDDTIRRNVAFGYDDKDIDDVRVWSCLREAQLEELIKSLPGQLDAITGENGIRLSGGQRQRIGIARAIYPNPEFLVLDEATSALDNDTEAAIMDAINALSRNKTLLVIAHRLSTIKDCDIVYRIGEGKVIKERGQ